VPPTESGPVRRRPPALLFGIAVSDVTMDETIEQIGELVAIGRRTGRTHQLTTVNVDFLVNALDDPDVARILQRSDLCLPDGMPVVWASRLLGMPLRERVAGADLVPLLIDASRSTGWHVHVFGSAPDIADRARALLAERYPGARFSIDPGPMIPDVTDVDDVVLDSIVAVDADIVCVALGNPKQERFIAAHRERLGAPVMLGVGGSLDMLVGHRPRAPRWMQASGLEWIWRAGLEPRRLGARYARDLRVFLPAVVGAWRASRRRRDGADLHLSDGRPGSVTATIGGATRSATTASDAAWAGATARLVGGADLTIERAESPPNDVALARLLGLALAARHGGATVTWPGVGSGGARPAWIDEVGVDHVALGLNDRLGDGA
jgi:exopolysaccharide biosynthesis WecB/TagA/CpsF family protein